MTLDPFTLSHWFAIGRNEDVPEGGIRQTRLLGTDITATRSGGVVSIVQASGENMAVQERYGHIWTTYSENPRALYDMPEFDEPGRRLVTAGSVSVRTSGLRVVENFLDMAHFPFVHTGILGDPDHTEVETYKVDMSQDPDEVWATKCTFFQPMAAASADDGGQMTEYMYRAPHPFSTILYKTCPIREGQWDLIGLFIQPREETLCDVHSFILVFDEDNTDTDLLHFQQNIFLQDRMILENQMPHLLPLEPRREMPTRADASSIAFRRWLKTNGVTYGVEPVAKVA